MKHSNKVHHNSYIAAIDQGTSSSRVLIVNQFGKIVGQHQMEHTQFYPSAGHVEHDPMEIWKSVKSCMVEALGKCAGDIKITSIGITNQRETTVVWNKVTGQPYHNAIVWNDTRTSSICERLVSKYGKDHFRQKTGLPITPYFSVTKLMYLLDNIPELRIEAEKGNALFGTIDSWLIWNLTNGDVHATDVTNASRTMMMDLDRLEWDDEILSALGIPKKMLPQIMPSAGIFGRVTVDEEEGSRKGDEQLQAFLRFNEVPISGVIGDQQAALVGQACLNKGDAKCTYGTGAFLLLNTGTEIVHSHHGLLTTVAYQLPGLPANYALEGSVAYCGSVIQWLRDNLRIIQSAKETEALALTVEDNGGVYFVPAFAGLYAPYWRNDARGVIVGLTAFNTKAHIVRAALEAAAFQTYEVVHAMERDSKAHIEALKVDGGMTANNLTMQFQSDLLGVPLLAPRITETTSMGAVFMSGLGVGVWKRLDEVKTLWQMEKQWKAHMTDERRNEQLSNWQKAVGRSLNWIEESVYMKGAGSAGTVITAAPAGKIGTMVKSDAGLPSNAPMGSRTLASIAVSQQSVARDSPVGPLKPSSWSPPTVMPSPTNLLRKNQLPRSRSWLGTTALLGVGIGVGVAIAHWMDSRK